MIIASPTRLVGGRADDFARSCSSLFPAAANGPGAASSCTSDGAKFAMQNNALKIELRPPYEVGPGCGRIVNSLLLTMAERRPAPSGATAAARAAIVTACR